MATVRGGTKLEAALAEMASKVAVPATLRVGFLENSKYPDGTPVALVAIWQEYGTPNAKHPIPPRPFFRHMIAEKSSEWPTAIAGLLKANDLDVVKALELAGTAIAGQLRQSIVDTNSPALSEWTIRAKGFSKPLVDTGHMLNSVDFEVKT